MLSHVEFGRCNKNTRFGRFVTVSCHRYSSKIVYHRMMMYYVFVKVGFVFKTPCRTCTLNQQKTSALVKASHTSELLQVDLDAQVVHKS